MNLPFVDSNRSALSEGWTAYEAGDFRRAIDDYSNHVQAQPTDEKGYFYRALAYMKAGDNALVLSDLLETIRLDPKHFDAYLNLDYLLAQESRFEEIVAFWNTYLTLEPNNGNAYLERGGAYWHVGKKALALKDAETSCKLGIEKGCDIVKLQRGDDVLHGTASVQE